MSHQRRRASFRAVVTNWRTYDAGFLEKLRLAMANNLTKLRTHRDCCGNEGQPGC